MCKKLSIFCLMLVVVGLSVPASAAYIGFDRNGNPGVNPLWVDLDGGGTATTKPAWQPWQFAQTWASPQSKTFENPLKDYEAEKPIVELTTFRRNTDPTGATSMSRNRSGGWAGVGTTGEYSLKTKGFGMNYDKLTITQLAPSTQYKFTLWSYEASNVWSMNLAGNPHSKFGMWSATDPYNWLINNGYNGVAEGVPNTSGEPNQGGYGPKYSIDNPHATTDSNMPLGLVAAIGTQGSRLWLEANDGNDISKTTSKNLCTFYASTNDEGTIALFGWIDPTDWGGSMHMPLNGLLIIPEPATIALLGLGGLALIRRKRA